MSKTEPYTESETTDAERRKRSKNVYKAVIRTVDFNTGRVQPPLAKQSSVIGSLHRSGYGSYGLEEVHRAITAARYNGDLFAVEVDGRPRIGINDVDTLREKIASCLEYQADDPPRAVIGAANARVQDLKRGERDE